MARLPLSLLLKKEMAVLGNNIHPLLMGLGLFGLLSISLKWMVGGAIPPQILLSSLSLFVMWVIFLSSDSLFVEDVRSGFLDVMKVERASLGKIIVIKLILCWITLGIPLCLLFLCATYLFTLTLPALPLLAIMLVVSWFYIGAGAFANAITLGAERQKSLLFLISLPFYVPLFIFQALLFEALIQGGEMAGYWQMLLGWGLIFTPVAGWGVLMSLNMVVGE